MTIECWIDDETGTRQFEDVTTAAASARKRFPWIGYAVALMLILLLALTPLISIVIATTVAEANGCRLNEGGVNPCVIGGRDYAALLANMFVLGWLMFATLPLGALGALVWLVLLIVHLAARRRAA